MSTDPNDPINPVTKYDSQRYEGGQRSVNPHLAGGLTKREYFAVMALQGILANGYMLETSVQSGQLGGETLKVHRIAVDAADSLIRELNKPAGGKI